MSKRASRGKRVQQLELLYGRQAVREALRANRRRLKHLYLAEGAKLNTALIDEIVNHARSIDIPVEQVDRRQLDEWLGSANHQGVALRSGPYPYSDLEDTLTLARTHEQDPLLLVLDRVQDPQNLGTLLRAAEAFGVHGIVLPKHRAAHISPAVANVSAGATEHLLVCQETNIVNTLKTLKKSGVWIAGLQAGEEAQPIESVDLQGPLAIVVGSEGYGLSRLVAETCDWLVALPMVGKIDSLNAATAGSISLYVAMVQRSKPELSNRT